MRPYSLTNRKQAAYCAADDVEIDDKVKRHRRGEKNLLAPFDGSMLGATESMDISLLSSGFFGLSGVIIGGVITYVTQRSLVEKQITAASTANQELIHRIEKQIDEQVRASELSAVSTLLNSVNVQLSSTPNMAEDDRANLENARGLYHRRFARNSQRNGSRNPESANPSVIRRSGPVS